MRLLLAVVISLLAARTSDAAQEMACEADGTCKSADQNAGPEDIIEDPCTNLKPNCMEWAARGDCRTNDDYMQAYCPRACGHCPPIDEKAFEKEEEQVDADCTDLHDLCDMWSKQGECVLNPKYMVRACPESCMLCVNVKASRERKESDDAIRRKKVYVKYIDAGPKQKIIGTKEEQGKIKLLLKRMDEYAKTNLTDVEVSQETRRLCRNELDECASWAVQGLCQENALFMLNNCALACQMCDKMEMFQQCVGKSDPRKKAAFEEGGIDKFFKEGKASGKWNDFDPEFITEPKEGGDEEDADPWIVRFDKFLSDEESLRLIEIGDEIGWKDSEVEEEEFASGNPSKIPPRRTSKSAICAVGADCDADPVYSRVLDRVATATGISRRHIENVELVKYDKADSFGVHHDYRIHDNWKPAGPRVLTMLLHLSDVEEGGSTGFPDLDWLFIKPKKGQALLFPNVLDSDPTKADTRMVHEGLPVARGTKYAANIYIHVRDWKEALEQDCV